MPRTAFASALAAGAIAATAAGPAAAAAPASQVRIGPAGATVTTAAGRATLTRSPFRLSFARPDGTVVLATAAAAPFGLTAGYEPSLRYPVLRGDPDPNPPGTTPPGPRFGTTGVQSLGRSGNGIVAVLRTNDPAGRTLAVTVAPDRGGTFAVEVGATGAPGIGAVRARFAAAAGERFHGFGGRREGTSLWARTITNWVLDYRFPDASTGYYYAQPLAYSSRGYGVLIDSPQLSQWRLGADQPHEWGVASRPSRLRLVIAPGGAARAIRGLTAITGRHRVAPAWSLGAALSRTVAVLNETPAQYQAKVQADVARLEREQWGVSAYAFEGWATLPPAFVRRTVARLHRRGIRVLLYLRAFVSDDRARTEPPGRFAEAVAKGYVARTAAGRPYLFDSPFPGAQAALIDFTNPAARRWWAGIVAGLLRTGADGFMNDFGEQALPGMHFASGATGAELHNRYPVLQHAATRAAVDAELRRHPRPAGVFFFVRAGSTGRPGSAASENATFPGDETVDWSRDTGLASVIPDMLNRAVGGAPGFTTDIGGYAQFTPRGLLPPPSAELFVRWSQLAALTPFFRVHNSGLDGVRMPWDYDAATQRAWRAMAALHRRAVPLLRRQWAESARTGAPLTRPLWLADPAAGGSARADDEWLVGRDLLVAPVVTPGATSRPVRLPPGCWRLHGSGPALLGSRTVSVPAPLGGLPWLARCGTRPLG